MYQELGAFLRHIAGQKSIWRDGELWTSLIFGIACGVFFIRHPSEVDAVREHFSDLLTVASIIFGFVLSTLALYVQAAGEWSKETPIQQIANRIVDWHVWTILCLLALIGCVIFIWAFGPTAQSSSKASLGICYGGLSFLSVYSGLQILNHALTIWWAFRHRELLAQGRTKAPPP